MSTASKQSSKSLPPESSVLEIEPVKSSASIVTVGTADKPFSVNDIVVSATDDYLAMFTFSLMGVSQLLIWNFVIFSFVSFKTYIWPEHTFAGLLGGWEHGAALLVSILMLRFNGLSSTLCHCTSIINMLLYAIIPMIPALLASEVIVDESGVMKVVKDNVFISKVLLSVACILLGFCSGLFHVQGYAFASICPRNYCGYVSIGNGIAGALSFFVFTLLFSIFPRTQKGQVMLLWVFFGFGAFCSLVQTVCFFLLSKREWFIQCIKISMKDKTEDNEKTLRSWGPRRNITAIFKDCWVQAFNASFTLFVTLFLFPMTGPFGWHQSDDMGNILLGTFQVIDLLLRWLPMLGGFTKLSKKVLLISVIARPFIMIPLFLLPAQIKGLPVLGSLWWLFILMGLFTITNGWFVSLGAIYCPECVTHPKEKEVASDIFVMMLLACVTAGVFASELPPLMRP